jgi:hypothetical protein
MRVGYGDPKEITEAHARKVLGLIQQPIGSK